MRKIFKGLAAALALTSAIAASVPAEARRGDDRYAYRGDYHGWDGGRHWRGDRIGQRLLPPVLRRCIQP